MRLMTIAIAFLALFAVSLPAQSGDPGGKKKDRQARRIEKFDKNGDGKLDNEERKAMRKAGEARKKKRQEEGKNKGNTGEKGKKGKRKGKGKGEAGERKGKGDVSGQDEKKGKGKRKGKGENRGKRGERRKGMLKRFDKNGDGELDEIEKAEMKKAKAARRGKKKDKEAPIK
jgi:hypothetical protein